MDSVVQLSLLMIYVVINFLKQGSCNGQFKYNVTSIRYHNRHGKCFTKLCDYYFLWTDWCDFRFKVFFSDNKNPSFQSKVFHDRNMVEDLLIPPGKKKPVPQTFSGSKRNLSLRIEVEDYDGILNPDKCDKIVGTVNLQAKTSSYRLNSNHVSDAYLVINVTHTCDDYYYGDDCLKFCRGQNDSNGHYYCDGDGRKACYPGFEDISTNCTKNCLDLTNCTQGCLKCSNGGICKDSNGTAYCDCPGTYEGAQCNTDVDECDIWKGICNNGRCQNTRGGYKCFCSEGFKGNHCNESRAKCSTEPCKDDANCTDARGGYNCSCTPGFYGRHCDLKEESFFQLVGKFHWMAFLIVVLGLYLLIMMILVMCVTFKKRRKRTIYSMPATNDETGIPENGREGDIELTPIAPIENIVYINVDVSRHSTEQTEAAKANVTAEESDDPDDHVYTAVDRTRADKTSNLDEEEKLEGDDPGPPLPYRESFIDPTEVAEANVTTEKDFDDPDDHIYTAVDRKRGDKTSDLGVEEKPESVDPGPQLPYRESTIVTKEFSPEFVAKNVSNAFHQEGAKPSSIQNIVYINVDVSQGSTHPPVFTAPLSTSEKRMDSGDLADTVQHQSESSESLQTTVMVEKEKLESRPQLATFASASLPFGATSEKVKDSNDLIDFVSHRPESPKSDQTSVLTEKNEMLESTPQLTTFEIANPPTAITAALATSGEEKESDDFADPVYYQLQPPENTLPTVLE